MNLSRLKKARAAVVDRLGRARLNRLAMIFCRVLGVDPLEAAYEMRGIYKFQNLRHSGELHVLENIIAPRIAALPNQNANIIEVGANVGEYSRQLARLFPQSNIHVFEPGKAFEKLSANLQTTKVHTHHLGCGSESATLELFTYAHEEGSSHSTLLPQVFSVLHGDSRVISETVEIVTLDSFCAREKIEHCHFLKIDVEGHEMEVLRGAKRLIERGAIDVIQWEFNSMNVISRVFLRDFYEVLSDYDIFRLNTRGLIPLPNYQARNEIFEFQNFLAIRRSS